jgi:hypothetical protein
MEIDRKMEAIDDKLSRVDDTAVVMERVVTLVNETKEVIDTEIAANHKSTDERIKRIYTDELWYDNKFGPNAKGKDGE